ncbi:MAG: response regulator [Chromatiales bacterium]
MKVLIVDDHALFREGLKSLFHALDLGVEVDEVSDCAQAVAKSPSSNYDVILLDLKLPGVGWLDGLALIRESFPSTRVVVLSGEDDPQTVRASIDGGASGFIPKSTNSEIFVYALKLVMAGGIYLPIQVFSAAATRPKAEPDDVVLSTTALEGLTDRHQEVLRAIIQGKSNKAIARELGVTEATIKAHVSSVLRTLGARNRTEAVYEAAKRGLHVFEHQKPPGLHVNN